MLYYYPRTTPEKHPLQGAPWRRDKSDCYRSFSVTMSSGGRRGAAAEGGGCGGGCSQGAHGGEKARSAEGAAGRGGGRVGGARGGGSSHEVAHEPGQKTGLRAGPESEDLVLAWRQVVVQRGPARVTALARIGTARSVAYSAIDDCGGIARWVEAEGVLREEDVTEEEMRRRAATAVASLRAAAGTICRWRGPRPCGGSKCGWSGGR